MPRELTRGGRKLQAGIDHFDLASKVRSAHAIDVGASTGGFVQVLLQKGARRVSAVDVGHGQLLPDLASDPRVESAEGTDFKTLSLQKLPGPFDFFTVDVSFMAGRSMLRPLAFRLKDGAHGIVLLKPQFELPSHRVKGGDVSDPQLRREALDLFSAKASRLGFSILGQFDSPVEGGSGTVEILVHLRFDGRPEALPRKGERKEKKPASKKGPSPLPKTLRWFAVAAPGLEDILGEELEAIPGIHRPSVVPGGVEIEGPLTTGMQVNLHSRIATRVLLRLGQVKARDFAPLRRGLAKLPFAHFVPNQRPLRVDATTNHCRLYHTGALAETVELALGDTVGKLPERNKDTTEDTPLTRIFLRGEDDHFTVSIDASGQLLHKRGYRTDIGTAPLRETLAAAILRLCHYDPTLPLVDPMCGSGTFSIEAAAIASQLAPGRARDFAFTTWPCHDASAWQAILGQAAEMRQVPTGPICASDLDPKAVECARQNADRAGLAASITFATLAFEQVTPPSGKGLVILNPPYGHRLGDRQRILKSFRALGMSLKRSFPNYQAAILCPDRQALTAVEAGYRKKAMEVHGLQNGGLRILLAIWEGS